MLKQFYALLFISAMLFSCEEIDELTKFDVDYQTSFTVSSTVLIESPFNLFTPEVTTESESTFEENNTRKDLIESIKLKTIKLTLTSPEEGNFNFLKEIHIYIKSENNNEIEIAYLIDLENTNSKIIELTLSGEELKDYIKDSSYTLRVKSTTDETLSKDHNITIDTKFRVDAKIFGL
jgi:hypothetical protein